MLQSPQMFCFPRQVVLGATLDAPSVLAFFGTSSKKLKPLGGQYTFFEKRGDSFGFFCFHIHVVLVWENVDSGCQEATYFIVSS